ncbi:sulfite exporter TauE/SafE/copper chaperone CopZ [Anaerosolibacter carboniphilus]|uniref:Sulfite exporter TauE/SafE/copper chaperone CopZ n=1 Tax=Anaerosolibacter carboniphilus TaxID=1417629 RepID=A0A841KRI4_9FIRM|nr:sulfite exporter TauE/SafE family protein [Anaerosolibacter carboniphilus]MBB6216003.1 sulfite exporter TauE/SafE/copper chaperone CopZ [Anaerosolibacter carboniphilus]
MKRKLALKITGMYCENCSKKIKNALGSMSVEKLEVSFASGELVCLTDDKDGIIAAIHKLGYTAEAVEEGIASRKNYKGVIVALFVLLGIYLIIKNTIGFNMIPKLQEQVSYGILFVLGMATSLHCLSMCGGIVISQSIAFENPMKSTLQYNLGRVIAYTTVGAAVGGIGSIVSFSPMLKGYITIFAGVFMILMGLSMLQPFIFLRRYVKTPQIFNVPKFKSNRNTPLFVGLATGLMPCGPLQTMQIYALGTGSIAKGAFSMFVFSMGTVPLMVGLGTISGYISSGINKKLLKLSSVFVVILGLIVVNRGLALQGKSTVDNLVNPTQASSQIMLPEMMNGFQVINTSANSNGYEPNYFILEKGKPVNWVITGDSVNSCNNEIVIPELNISQKINEGYNIIQFTPAAEGELGFSCWMGMLDGKFIVVDDIRNIPDHIDATPPTPVSCCTD